VPSFFRWRRKYAGVSAADVKRLGEFETESAKLRTGKSFVASVIAVAKSESRSEGTKADERIPASQPAH